MNCITWIILISSIELISKIKNYERRPSLEGNIPYINTYYSKGRISLKISSTFCIVKAKGSNRVMILGVNYVSLRLHRNSVCPIDCETSVIIISRRRRKRERKKGGGRKRNMEKESDEKAQVQGSRHTSVSEVFNSRQSTVLSYKRE